MRVLVIGATGFIGTRVVDELILRHGDAARVTIRDYRRAVRLGRLPVEWAESAGDDVVRLQEAASGCDAVICCAHPFSSAREGAEAVAICRAAAAAAERTSTGRLVFLSSTAIYGGSGVDVTEDSPAAPDSPYGRVKLRCEQTLRGAHDAGAIRLIVLRPSIVYGPFSPSWTVLPARQMQSADLVLPREAPGACNAIYVDDVARAVGEAVRLKTAAAVALNLNAPGRAAWRDLYAPYANAVRPGSLVEWPIDAIQRARKADRAARSSLSAARRAMRDRAVRDRLNDIPLLAGLNRLSKAIGWRGLPPADPASALRTMSESGPEPEARRYPPHVPAGVFLDLYLHGRYVDGSRAREVLGVTPRDLRAGMVPTIEWLEWAGLSHG